MSYDIKFKKRTIEYLEEGNSYRKTSEIFGISPNTLNRWVKRYRKTGQLENAPVKKRRFRKIDPEKLKTILEETPDAYQTEIAKQLGCTQQSVFSALKRLGIKRKKRPNVTVSRIRKK